MSKGNKVIGQILRNQYMKAAGLTDKTLSEKLGYSKVYINSVINGLVKIGRPMAEKLARAFPDTSPEFWMGQKEQEPVLFEAAQPLQSVDMIQIRSDSEFPVDARQLHAYLELGRDFTNWIKDQIDRARLVEGRHFLVVYAEKGEKELGRPKQDYLLTIDASMHIGMIANTDKGFEVREYFISAEKKLRAVQQPMDELEMLSLMIKGQLEDRNKMKALVKTVDALQSQIDTVKAHLDLTEEMSSVRGFLSLHKIFNLPKIVRQTIGSKATKICELEGLPKHKIPDIDYGEVGAYPKVVLERVVREMGLVHSA